jgi:hypothetical protein
LKKPKVYQLPFYLAIWLELPDELSVSLKHRLPPRTLNCETWIRPLPKVRFANSCTSKADQICAPPFPECCVLSPKGV